MSPDAAADLLRARAGHLADLAERVGAIGARAPWTGLAADALRERCRVEAARLRDAADLHAAAASAFARVGS